MSEISRRAALRLITFVAGGLPLVLSEPAVARRNQTAREALKYTERADGAKHCTNCKNFKQDYSQRGGHCVYIPDDDEVSPLGYCPLWTDRTAP